MIRWEMKLNKNLYEQFRNLRRSGVHEDRAFEKVIESLLLTNDNLQKELLDIESVIGERLKVMDVIDE